MLLVELEEETDKEKLLEKKELIKERWEVRRLDEDLTMEERRVKWRREKKKGREVKTDNRRI